MLINTLIVDDEALARRRIRDLLSVHPAFFIVGECKNGGEAIEAIQLKKPHLIFLDIQMKDMDGFQVLATLPQAQFPLVVFVTAYDQFAIKAFDHFAFDYLLKPFKDERFEQSIKKAQAIIEGQLQSSSKAQVKDLLDYFQRFPKPSKSSNNKILPVKTGGKVNFIDMEDILYVIASGYYIEIFTAQRKFLLRESMSSIIEKLDPNLFIRIHRSTIINTQYLRAIDSIGYGDVEVQMKDEKSFRVSKSYKDALFGRLGI